MTLTLARDSAGRRQYSGGAGLGNASRRFSGCAAVANRRAQLTAYLRMIGNTAAWYQPAVGVTGTLNASAWADQSGNGNSLLQASGANQPIIVPWANVNHLWQHGIPGNYASAPDSVPLALSQKFVIIWDGALDDWTPTGGQNLVAKYTTVGNQRSYALDVADTGKLELTVSADGQNASSLVSSAAPTVSDRARLAVRADYDGSVANATFYTATSAAGPWTQLGTVPTAAAATPFQSTAVLEIGSSSLGTAGVATGKTFRVKIINGTFAAGTLVFDADFTQLAEGTASFTESSANAATVTVNTTGAVPARVIGSPKIITDAAAYFMQASYTANQPRTYYIVGMDPAWAAGQYIADGTTANRLGLSKTTGTPKVSVNAGSAACEDPNLTLLAKHIITVVLNGAGSSITIDNGTPTTGNAGAGNPGGLTIGADGGGLNFGGFWFDEIIDRSVADTAATQAVIRSFLKPIHGTP